MRRIRSAAIARPRTSRRRCSRSAGGGRRRLPDDPGFATEALDALRLHYDWLDHHRDPDHDGLISIIHPDESGLDDSPKYDDVFGWMSHYLPGYIWLVERSRRLRYDSRAIIARYDEHVEDVLVNVLYALSLRALSRLSGDGAYIARAERTEQALIDHCWDERRGLFWDLAGRDHRPLRVSTWSSLAPLALPSLPDEIATRLIEEHLLHPRRYGAPYGIPSVSMEEPSFRAGWHLFRCWRGPSWINTAWLLVPALRRRVTQLRRTRSSPRASRRSSATGSASTTTRSTAKDSQPAASAGPRCWSICCPRRAAGRAAGR